MSFHRRSFFSALGITILIIAFDFSLAKGWIASTSETVWAAWIVCAAAWIWWIFRLVYARHDDDPRVAVRCEKERRTGSRYQKKPHRIILNNAGKRDAREVQIQPILLHPCQIHFEKIALLVPDKDTSAEPSIRGTSGEQPRPVPRQDDDIQAAFQAEYDRRGDLNSGEIAFPFTISYRYGPRNLFTKGAFFYNPCDGEIEARDLTFGQSQSKLQSLRRRIAVRWFLRNPPDQPPSPE
jgi:hypothetical protein